MGESSGLEKSRPDRPEVGVTNKQPEQPDRPNGVELALPRACILSRVLQRAKVKSIDDPNTRMKS
jgi:hypothetical protein